MYPPPPMPHVSFSLATNCLRSSTCVIRGGGCMGVSPASCQTYVCFTRGPCVVGKWRQKRPTVGKWRQKRPTVCLTRGSTYTHHSPIIHPSNIHPSTHHSRIIHASYTHQAYTHPPTAHASISPSSRPPFLPTSIHALCANLGVVVNSLQDSEVIAVGNTQLSDHALLLKVFQHSPCRLLGLEFRV